EQIDGDLAGDYGRRLATSPALEDASRLTRDVARKLNARGALHDPVSALSLKESPGQRLLSQTVQALEIPPRTFAEQVLRRVNAERDAVWRKRVKEID